MHVYYNEILNYLLGNSNYSGISDVLEKKRQEFGPTTEEDLARVARAAPFVNTNMQKQYEKVKQSYDKTGNFEVTAHLNQNQDDNIDMKQFNNYDQSFEEQKNSSFREGNRIIF